MDCPAKQPTSFLAKEHSDPCGVAEGGFNQRQSALENAARQRIRARTPCRQARACEVCDRAAIPSSRQDVV